MKMTYMYFVGLTSRTPSRWPQTTMSLSLDAIRGYNHHHPKHGLARKIEGLRRYRFKYTFPNIPRYFQKMFLIGGISYRAEVEMALGTHWTIDGLFFIQVSSLKISQYPAQRGKDGTNNRRIKVLRCPVFVPNGDAWKCSLSLSEKYNPGC